MSEEIVAIYARVSSTQQVEANTIESQLAALKERVAADGFALASEMQFIDEGYSGATLLRPALEKLRDAAAIQGLDRLYVHSPDRLARKYAYQVLLVDELKRLGVEVVFLNRELGRSPEDDLLLQVQGVVAEYERAKIMERCRRGRRHGALKGSVNVLSNAPYGYRYISKHQGGGEARYEIALEEARIVRQIFDWVGRERMTLKGVSHRLMKAGERAPRGGSFWDRSAVWRVLSNPAYKGAAAFGKTRLGPPRPKLRIHRGNPPQPRRTGSSYRVPREEWTTIPVPAIVSEEIFDAVQEQLEENRRRVRARDAGARHLLQGLLACKKCGYAYAGRPSSSKRIYYRCLGTDSSRFGGGRVCDNRMLRADFLEQAVWQEAKGLLENPVRIREEFQRRLSAPRKRQGADDPSLVQSQIDRIRRGISRITTGYADGLIDRAEFETQVKRLKERLAKLEIQAQQLADEALVQSELQLVVGRLEEFSSRVKTSLGQADWLARRDIILTLVKRVEVGEDQVTVVFRVAPPSGAAPEN